MTNSEAKMWCIRAGKLGEADSIFLQQNYVALGWPEVGDYSKIGPDKETFKAAVAMVYPDMSAGGVANSTGQLLRFAYEVQEGDYVLYPRKSTREIYIGRITGPYLYKPEIHEHYHNLRSVQWLKSFPRTHFTQGALYEVNSLMTIFQVKNYADEFKAALEGRIAPPKNINDPTVKATATDIEETTRDFVLKQLAQELKGHPFAGFVAHLLERMGYRTRVSPPGPDGGIDVIAHKDELGFEPPIIKVQVKSNESSVGDPVVSALYGKVASGEFGLLITLGTFTPKAKAFADTKSNLRLIDGDELVKLVLAHYEQFDSLYKGLIPLKRVYIPEVIEQGEE